ncbi:MAG: hypothetical protein IH953_00515 [Chloroflexi bacterium]|nr:hypothetical protein [Chloroflexota bacterium]
MECSFDTCLFWTISFEALLAALLTLIVGGLGAYFANRIYRIPKYEAQQRILLKLAELRTEGVGIRNDGMKDPLEGQLFDDWATRIIYWEQRLYEKAEEFSPVEKERLKTLDLVPILNPNEVLGLQGKTISPAQLKILSETNETLKRLDRMLENKFRPTQSP